MPVYKTVIKYANDTQPFVALVSKRRSEFERIFTPRFKLIDHEIRDAIRSWARSLDEIEFTDGDFSPLIEDIFGRLIETIIDRADRMFVPIKTVKARKSQLDYDIEQCVPQYMALDIVVDILGQCFGRSVRRPSPECLVNAAIILKNRPLEARNFLYHARMPSLDHFYKPPGA